MVNEIPADHAAYLASVEALIQRLSGETYTDELDDYDAGDDYLTSHDQVPDDPFEQGGHWDQGGVSRITVTPHTNAYSGMETSNSIDFCEIREPYAMLGQDVCEPVTTLTSPERAHHSFPGTVERGAATRLRAAGSATLNAATIMGTFTVNSQQASCLAIMARVISALEMTQSGWHATGGQHANMNVRVCEKDQFVDAQALFPNHIPFYIPDEMKENEIAALISLCVVNGPAAYNWTINAPAGAAIPHVMPAGARYAWPGGTGSFLLVTETARPWNVAFGAAALATGPLELLLNRMMTRYGQEVYHEAIKVASIVNRCYGPVNYDADPGSNGIRGGLVSKQCMLNGIRANLAGGDRTNVRGDALPHSFVDADNRTFAHHVFVNQSDIDVLGAALATNVPVDPNAPAGTVQTFIRAYGNDLGIDVICDNGRAVFPWTWAPPIIFPQATRDALNRLWNNSASAFAPAKYYNRQQRAAPPNDGEDDWRENRTRSAFGSVDQAGAITLPRWEMDGWYPVLIGINTLARIRYGKRKIAMGDIKHFMTRYFCDMHLMFTRRIHDIGLSPSMLGGGSFVSGASIMHRLPQKYHAAIFPRELTDYMYPFGNWECMESSSHAGGTNTTDYVGLEAPGSWHYDKLNRAAWNASARGADSRRTRRAMDSACRHAYYEGGRVYTTSLPDTFIAQLRTNYGAGNVRKHIYHPFALPSQYMHDGESIKSQFKARAADNHKVWQPERNIHGGYTVSARTV